MDRDWIWNLTLVKGGGTAVSRCLTEQGLERWNGTLVERSNVESE